VDSELPSKSKICVPVDRDYLVILVELTQLPNSYFTIGVELGGESGDLPTLRLRSVQRPTLRAPLLGGDSPDVSRIESNWVG
jgi:hypothetical protein